MGQFDTLNQKANAQNLRAMGTALDAATDLERKALKDMQDSVEAKKQIATIAEQMGQALNDNTDAMHTLYNSLEGSLRRFETVENTVYERVERRAQQTLSAIDTSCQNAIDKANANAEEAVKQIETARKAFLSTVLSIVIASAVVLIIAIYLGIGQLHQLMVSDESWIKDFGFLPGALIMVVAVVEGIVIYSKSK